MRSYISFAFFLAIYEVVFFERDCFGRAPQGHATATSQPYSAAAGRSPAPALLCCTLTYQCAHKRSSASALTLGNNVGV